MEGRLGIPLEFSGIPVYFLGGKTEVRGHTEPPGEKNCIPSERKRVRLSHGNIAHRRNHALEKE